MIETNVTTKNLNRVLGRTELMSMAVGQIIGAGIMSMTGIAIGMTGKSVFWAFLIAAVFTGLGIVKVQPGFFSEPYFLTSGKLGLLSTAAFLTFATGGANIVLNYGTEAKDPVKDIPFVIIVSTVCVAILYGLMSIVAAGVLPVPEVANKPLTLVAAEILPKPLYVFFIVCGALFALTTTLNSQIRGVTKPVLQACVDGWFPKKIGSLHPKYKTPVHLLLLFYIVGMLPILTGWDIGLVGNKGENKPMERSMGSFSITTTKNLQKIGSIMVKMSHVSIDILSFFRIKC